MNTRILACFLSIPALVNSLSAQSWPCPPVIKRYNTTIVSMTGNGGPSLTRPIRDGRGNVLVPEQLMVPVLFKIRHAETNRVSNYQVSVRYPNSVNGQPTAANFSRIPPFLVDPWIPGPLMTLPGDRELMGTLLLPGSMAGSTVSFTGVLTGIPGYYPPSACPRALRIDAGNTYTAPISLVVRYR